MNKLKKLLFISSALLLSTANNTFALTASGSITTSGTVVGTCSVSASPMAFGTLSQSIATVASSTVTATCSNGTAWEVTNAAATNKLYLGGSLSADSIAFPITVTSGGGSFVSSPIAGGSLTGLSSGSAQTASLTGTVAYANVNLVSAGSYSGSVTITITYQ